MKNPTPLTSAAQWSAQKADWKRRKAANPYPITADSIVSVYGREFVKCEDCGKDIQGDGHVDPMERYWSPDPAAWRRFCDASCMNNYGSSQ